MQWIWLRSLIVVGLIAVAGQASATEPETHGPSTPPAPSRQSLAEAELKSSGCVSCHSKTDQKTMHAVPSVVLGCTDCHGGSASVTRPRGAEIGSPDYLEAMNSAHVLPTLEDTTRSSANPPQSFTLLNRESPEWVRFINPGDLRVAREACGACHLPLVQAVERSLMATSAMFWGGASYNNGVLPFKRYIIGEAYTRDGHPALVRNPVEVSDFMKLKGIRPELLPLPAWETFPPTDVFRVFERGGRNIQSLFPETGLPNPLEEPGKPDIRASNRGPGTGARISVPVLNLTKTRLNDPALWFLGTSEHRGDFRSSGCSACHVIYANDRSRFSSGPYARYGNRGQTNTLDPTIRAKKGPDGEPESGHPIEHTFTRAIPTSQCMTCHHHQPNMFVNSYLGYTMWDYESDAPLLWPSKQRYPNSAEMMEVLNRNPEEASTRGLWADLDFLARVRDDINPRARHTQFADYHGHGWNFRAVFKRARDGTLLDQNGDPLDDKLPPAEKWERAVHLQDIHAERDMQCMDCHFSLDAHGNGHIYAEVAAAVEIRCRDCHGTQQRRANLRTSGPGAPPGGTRMSELENMDGSQRFVWRDRRLYQRLALPPHEERLVPQVRDSIDPRHPSYNPRAAYAKTLIRDGQGSWGPAAKSSGCKRAHDPDEMACATCHSSWVTSCAGCHLPVQANWKTKRLRYGGEESRNYTTYNPQVARDQMFMLGRHGQVKDGIISPIRSSSALILSSTDSNRNRVYVQQPPVSSAGFSSQAFAPHFPHTVRTTETKDCADCHLSEAGDNNAIMAQLLLLGTQFVNFVGFHAWIGTEASVEAVQVTEWDEPQAVIGSYLHKVVYPDWSRAHVERDRKLTIAHEHRTRRIGSGLITASPSLDAGHVGCMQLRGEYLYAAQGSQGVQVYDVASIGNKNISEKILTAPFSPLGHDAHVGTANATCIALPTTQPIRPELNRALDRDENVEQALHPIYSYAAVTDAEEGLILLNVETFADGEPRNNFLERAITWNPGGVLDGARHAVFAGHILYISGMRGIAVVDLDDPLAPQLLAQIPLKGARSAAVQFRYLFAVHEKGLQVVDVTHPKHPRVVPGARVPFEDGGGIHVARTYAYVAAGRRGLAVIDVERPESPRLLTMFDAGGKISDARDVIVGTTNASLFAYIADGENGLKVVQLTSPESQPKFYGFSPEPRPELIAWYPTEHAALSLSRPLERDRGVDETGHQIAVFGRVGSRPFTLEEMQRFYLDADGAPWVVPANAPQPAARVEICEE